MRLGINANPAQGFSPQELKDLGAQAVRFPIRLDFDYKPFIREAQALGLEIRPVLARESFRPGHYLEGMKTYHRRYPSVNTWQVGNESDQKGSASSWYLTPSSLSRLLSSARSAFGADAVLVAAGMVSGQPEYLDRVDLSEADALAIHPYGQRGWDDFPRPGWGFGNVADLLDLYRRFNKPLWVTEFGGEAALFRDEHERAQYLSNMVIALNEAGVVEADYFCYSDLMVDSFGLLDQEGNPKESYAAFLGATGYLAAGSGTTPSPAGKPTPQVISVPGNVVKSFNTANGRPMGFILHATRSGQNYSERQEFDATVNYVKAGAGGLGWNCTVGPGIVADHVDVGHWAWNAREASPEYLAIEVAQAKLGQPISQATFDTLVWWIHTQANHVPRYFINHSDLTAGRRDGKSDLFPANSEEGRQFIARLRTALAQLEQ